ncbi:MAG: calcium/sodium antiporter [Lentisphaerae bacterium]|nr:calcium/sodium antiporter [Lentisphaerota bacterium]
MPQFLIHLLYIAAGTAALYYGAEFLIKGGVAIARKAGVSSMVIGLTLVAFATSAPELVVSVSAGLSGSSDIALGNVIGSNICNIALILGLCGCIAPLPVDRKLFRFDLPVMVLSAIVLALLCFRGAEIGRPAGVLLFAGLLGYTAWNIYTSKKENTPSAEEEEKEETKPQRPLLLSILLVGVGVGLLIGGAHFFLEGAKYIAKLFNLSDAVIGLTVVAVGTSLPELATSLVAAIKKEQDIAIGNVVGSNIFNILGIIGIAPLVRPLSHYTINSVDLGMMLLCTIGLLPIMRTNWKISRTEGALMLALYAAYTAYLIIHHT